MATLVLVEGESDAGAVHAAAELLQVDLDARGIVVRPAAGITNFPKLLAEFVRDNPGARFCGMYDAADERHVRRALGDAGASIDKQQSPQEFGFFACDPDLEGELIRALGAQGVERVLAGEGELDSFRRFQAMPEHRTKRVEDQLHRFLGTRATRKIRCGRLLVEALGPQALPRPLQLLLSHLVAAN